MTRRACATCPTYLSSPARTQCCACLERKRVSDWTFVDRLAQAMGARHATARDVAKVAGTTTNCVEQWTQARTVPQGRARARVEAWMIPGTPLTARASALRSPRRTG